MAGGPCPRAVFVGPKLRIARTFHGLGQTELGERLQVGRTLVGQLEVGARQPNPELVAALSAELGFTRGFFAAPLADEVRDEECHGPSTPARRRALAHAGLLAELVAWLEDRVRLPEENLPEDVSTDDPRAIEAAAAACRSLWGLAPDLPLPSLTRALERAGVVVARVDGAAALTRTGRRPLVIVDAARSATGAGARFALARASGHLVLHRGADAGPVLEAEADHFAGALLLPREGLMRELPRSPSLDGEALAQLALRWGVSLAALVRRAAELPVANASRYRDAAPLVQSTADPDEAPEVLALALDELTRGRRVPRTEVARRLGWSPSIFAAVTGLSTGEERCDRVVSLAVWKAQRAGAPPALHGGAGQPTGRAGGLGVSPIVTGRAGGLGVSPIVTGAQIELDFGIEP